MAQENAIFLGSLLLFLLKRSFLIQSRATFQQQKQTYL